jgi:hypothetical protein
MEVRLVEKGRTSSKETMPSLLEMALAYTKAGISIIPISPNEGTAPDSGTDPPFDYSEYVQQRIATQRNSASGLQMIDSSAWRR